MNKASVGLMVAGSLGGGLAIALMLTDWIELVPYPLVAGGVLYLTGAVIGLAGLDRRRRS